ncbi:hypothetical protein F8388_016635 [Cannabis sativa]|uniref:Reverse transcriptase zinc-binding domain-containing protein n=1 Tax=Cannabis sativa TaxID=3483 RepID=A0A7J6FAV3_CANSA|nr:hypothetical protein F8388_016635 [Cannabis sativa]
MVKTVLASLVYYIWKARNEVLWNQQVWLINTTVKKSQQMSKLGIKGLLPKKAKVEDKTWILMISDVKAHKVDYARNIWNRMVLPKHRFIGWQIVNNQLLTRDNLSRFLSISSPLCSVCCRENESHQHLFVHCCFTQKLTGEITKWCGQFDWSVDLNIWFSKAANSMQERVINTVILATLYIVWTNRNSCIFELSCKTVSTLSKEIKSCVKSRCLMGCNGGKGNLDSYILNLPNEVVSVTFSSEFG